MSNMTQLVDQTFLFITVISVVLLGLVTFFMIYFAFRYSRKRNPEAEEVEGSLALEITWTVIPTILVMFMFYYGYEDFKIMRQAPEDAMEVKATGRQWSWDFLYEGGKRSDKMVLPVGIPVKLRITALDVLHSLSIPAFRVKEDAVPGQDTMVWFIPENVGVFDLFCTEYCGVGHSAMLTKVRVVPEDEFHEWLEAGMELSGAELLKAKGCLGCHSTDGKRKVGPTFSDLLGRKSVVVTSGKEREITADKEYIKRSILEPKADVVKGYPPVMPALKLSDDELKAIVGHLSGGETSAGPSAEKGREVAKAKGCLGCHSTDGKKKVGPTFKGLLGRRSTVITDGKESEITADEEYIRRSILEPKADVAKGYPPIMPVIKLEGEETEALLMFIGSLKDK